MQTFKKPMPEFDWVKKLKGKRLPKWVVYLSLLIAVLMFCYFVIFGISTFYNQYQVTFPKMIQIKLDWPIRVVKRAALVSQIDCQTVTPTPQKLTEVLGVVSGKASVYTEKGCLGCDSELIMANGEKLDDTKLTVALTPDMVSQYKLLNKQVEITNLANDRSVLARVTDTGGFAKYGRVADLSLATQKEINCSDLCYVQVKF